MAQKTLRGRQTFKALPLLRCITEDGNTHTGAAQVPRDRYAGDRHETDPRVLDFMLQQLPEFLPDQICHALGAMTRSLHRQFSQCLLRQGKTSGCWT